MTHRGPSPHLSWNEMACKNGTPYPLEWRKTRAVFLSRLFEVIRREAGNKPIEVVSAFRTLEYNARIGGARFSQHTQGRALDLRPPEGHSVQSFFDLIRKLPKANGLRGLGLYRTFVHIDIRDSDNLIIWSGKGKKDDNSTD